MGRTSSGRQRWIASAFVAAAWIAMPAEAQAQAPDDRFWAEASLYWPAVDTDIWADNLATANPGTEIDFESDLDLSDRKTLPAVLVGARLGSGFSIVGEYFRVKRSNSATIDREIVVDDVTYPVDAVLDASFASDVYRLSIGWAFARGENYEAGAVLGLHATDFEVSLAGQGSVNGQPLSNEVRRKDVLAPLPTLGLFGTWEVMEDLTLNGRFDFMSLGIDDFDGRLINFQANLVYRVFDNVGIGIGYRYVDYRVDVDNDDWIGRADYAFNGPHVLLQVGFR